MDYAGLLTAAEAPSEAPAHAARAAFAGQRWSDPQTWPDGVPPAGSTVRIAPGRTVLLDQDIDVAGLHVEGTLQIARRDTRIAAGWVLVCGEGRLEAGTPAQPFDAKLQITLCSAGRGIAPHPLLGHKFLAAVDGGTIELHGEQRTSWVPLGMTVAPGHNTLRLAQPVDWRTGERIAIASGADHALVEERAIVMVGTDRLTVTLDRALAHRHHGSQTPLQHRVPGSVAKALLLHRNIVVEGCADSERSGQGGYCMIGSAAAGTDADAAQRHAVGRFSGVEFRRMGQLNCPGRYPLLWNNNGEAADSAASGCLVRDCYQRGIVSAGSPHVLISDNVVLKPYGHGFIVDAGDDSPQFIASNLAVRPRVARFADSTMRGYGEHRPRAYWVVRQPPSRAAAQSLHAQ